VRRVGLDGLRVHGLRHTTLSHTDGERVTGIEPASRAWKALSRARAAPAQRLNGEVKTDIPGIVVDRWKPRVSGA
jgi:hypothetical protein